MFSSLANLVKIGKGKSKENLNQTMIEDRNASCFSERALSWRHQWEKISSEEKEFIKTLAKDLRASGIVIDRKKNFHVMKRAFSGQEAIDWMISSSRASSREEGKEFGQLMIVGDILHSVHDGKDFEDSTSFYRFADDEGEEVGPSVYSVLENCTMHGHLTIRKDRSSREKTYYCVLSTSPRHVFYKFKSDASVTPSGFVNFEKAKCTVQYASSSKAGFTLTVTSMDNPTRFAKLSGFDSTHLHLWVKAFVEMGAEYVEEPTVHVATASNIYDFSEYSIDGRCLCFDQAKNQVCLFTTISPFENDAKIKLRELGELHKKYSSHGLRIFAFLCDQFTPNEMQSSEENAINDLKPFGLSFQLMSKVNVNGPQAARIFAYMRHVVGHDAASSFVDGNFTYFLVNRDGLPVKRFAPSTNHFEIESEVRSLLGQNLSKVEKQGSLPTNPKKTVDMGTSPLKMAASPHSINLNESSQGRFPMHQDLDALFDVIRPADQLNQSLKAPSHHVLASRTNLNTSVISPQMKNANTSFNNSLIGQPKQAPPRSYMQDSIILQQQWSGGPQKRSNLSHETTFMQENVGYPQHSNPNQTFMLDTSSFINPADLTFLNATHGRKDLNSSMIHSVIPDREDDDFDGFDQTYEENGPISPISAHYSAHKAANIHRVPSFQPISYPLHRKGSQSSHSVLSFDSPSVISHRNYSAGSQTLRFVPGKTMRTTFV